MKKETISSEQKHDFAVANATFCTESVFNSMRTIRAFSDFDVDASALTEQVFKQVDKVIDGDTSRLELMLMTQAQTLDVMFHKMMQTSIQSKLIGQLQAYAELGFKAQNQCRKALLALAEIKNPKRATFIKQQNNAVNQQVNNGINPKDFKKPENTANELLSEDNHEALEFGRAAEAVSINSQLESVGAVNRGENIGR